MGRKTPKPLWKLLRSVTVGWQVPADSHHDDVRSHVFIGWCARERRLQSVVTSDGINDRIRAENH